MEDFRAQTIRISNKRLLLKSPLWFQCLSSPHLFPNMAQFPLDKTFIVSLWLEVCSPSPTLDRHK